VTPAVVVGFLFLYMFDQETGVANLLLLHLHVIPHRLAWLSDATLAPAAVIVANVWSQTPFFVLMFTAGLTAIPAAQREAIRIDGARGWAEFRHLTLPYLRHIMVIASLIAIINNFSSFTVIWTLFPVYWMLVTAFKTTIEIFSLRLQLVPAHPTLENFVEMWTGVVPVRTFFANSVVTSGLTCALTIAVSVLAGFAFSRMQFRY